MDILEIQILISVLLTSTLSGIIGMGGGAILMVVYSSLLPVRLAMILHGITQFSSNGSRAIIHRNNIKFSILMPYLIGVIIMFTFLRSIAFIPNKGVIYLLLGLFPFIGLLPKLSHSFNITKKHRPFYCGLLVTAAQISSGASGGVLDIFYINSSLSRHEIIATKAFTQTLGHFTKLIYYTSLSSHLSFLQDVKWFVYPGVVITATTGSYIGKLILDRLDEKKFRDISKVVIYLISIGLIYKAFNFFLRVK